MLPNARKMLVNFFLTQSALVYELIREDIVLKLEARVNGESEGEGIGRGDLARYGGSVEGISGGYIARYSGSGEKGFSRKREGRL